MSPASWDAGGVLAGKLPTRIFTVTNNGVTDLVFGTVTLGGGDAAEFEVRNEHCAGATVAPFATCTFTVAYLRNTLGAKTASVSLSSNDPDGVTTVALAGRGLICTPPPPGLVSWWRAEGDAADAAGANNGALAGGAAFAQGKVGQAFSFDGVDDYVNVPDTDSLDVTTAITLQAWVKPASLVNVYSTVVAKRQWSREKLRDVDYE